MSSPVFVQDGQGTPLMPTSAAYARRLLRSGKAQWVPHHAFPSIQLTRVIQQPTLRPLLVGIAIHLHHADLYLVASSERAVLLLFHCVVDLRTDLPVRMRRRAAHRKRRRNRMRYRQPRSHGRPFKLRRPSMLKSAWSKQHYLQRVDLKTGMMRFSPVIRWRVQAIIRVIRSLQKLMPISHAALLSPIDIREPHRDYRTAKLRQRLIDTYGHVTPDGERQAMCAYCLTTRGRIEVEHIVPVSRGGTDGWQNRVLACAACNMRKGGRLPDEAGMPVRITLVSTHAAPNRAGNYARSTARLLVASLRTLGIAVDQRDENHNAAVSEINTVAPLYAAAYDFSGASLGPIVIAKPIARPTKQVFTGHNYPLATSLRPGWTRIGQTIRRRVRVNRALIIDSIGGQRQVRVIQSGDALPTDVAHIITAGMFCEALRQEHKVQGIVSAIHSAGRLTLLVPETADAKGIHWRRVVVSPRQHLRVLSTDKVIFLHLLARSKE